MGGIDLNKRQTIWVAATGSALWFGGYRLAPALADDEPVGAIESNARGAQELLGKVTSLSQPQIYAQAEKVLHQEFQLRLEISQALGSVDEPDLLDYVREDEQHLVEFFIKYGVPLNPKPHELRDAGYSPIAEFPAEAQGIGDVLLDIFWDAIELPDIKEVVRELIRESPDLEAILNKAAYAVRRKDWEQLADSIDALFTAIGALQIFDRLVDKLGPEKARRFMRLLGLRFVPFVGWIYVVIAILISVKKHWPALISVIEDSR